MNQPPLNDCGCCEGLEPQTPAPIENRPGLSAIAYRCGTHAQFKTSMLAALSNSARPALANLNTRDADDFSIALLDAWATTADVLSFYQERIAQESYLRTASERQSLLQLGRLIGYELRSGVAASTYLAFTLESAPGMPRASTVEIGTKVQSIPGPGESPQMFETVEKIDARAEWNELPARQTQPQQIDATTAELHLEGVAANLRKGDALLLLGPESASPRVWDVCRVDAVTTEFEKNRTRVSLNEKPTHFTSPVPGGDVSVFAFRQRAAVFGHNAPDRRVLTAETLAKFETNPAGPVVAIPALGGVGGIGGGSGGLFGGLDLSELFVRARDWNFTVSDGGANDVDLDTTYASIVVGSWIALRSGGQRLLGRVTAAVEAGRTDYTLTGKITRLTIEVVAGSNSLTDFDALVRSTTVFGESQALRLGEAPVLTSTAGTQLTITGEIDELAAGRVVAVTGKLVASGAAFSAVVTLTEASVDNGYTTLRFTPAIPALDVDSVRVNANVALATHGETVGEILGSADASIPFQRFSLRQPPLTYVRAANPSGSISTLQVRVNDILWHEAPSFYGRGPNEHIYITRTGDDGVTTVQFGDGLTGARPPTGQDNVRATYRRGSGLQGQVKAGQLTTLLSRPPGLKGAVNPIDATGAAEREQLADARRNAPVTVLTLGRIVSLRDYEDFVRAFAGVGKALATWTWDGRQRGVFVTVAGADGAEIEMSSSFGKNLLAAVRQASVPGIPVRIQSYRRATGLFTLSGSIKVHPDYEPARVLAAVRSALETAFSFATREFGQSVNLSEVIAIMQATAGVIAVDVNELRRVPLPPDISAALPSLSRIKLQAVVRRLASPVLSTRFTSLKISTPEIATPGTLRPAQRLTAAVPQGGTRDASITPAELLVLAPLPEEQIGVMP